MKTIIIAHAGLLGFRPNSIESIRPALEHGAGGIEFDLRCSREGVPFFAHDRELPGPEGQVYLVDQLPEEDLFSPRFGGRPRMEEVLRRTVRSGMLLNLDVKDPSALEGAIGILEREGKTARSYFTGLSPRDLRRHRSLLNRARAGGARVFVNLPSLPGVSSLESLLLSGEAEHIDGINIEYSAVGAGLAEAVRSLGMKLSVWTVDSAEDLSRMVSLGCGYITTNRPDLAERAEAGLPPG